MIVLVKDAFKNSPPKRLDFSGLKPDSMKVFDLTDEPKVRIRSGSLSEQRNMEYLISTNNALQQSTGGHHHHHHHLHHKEIVESPAVLVIRSKKHSLDEGEQKVESSQILEAETYKMQRTNHGKPEWTKETLLKESKSK